MAEGSLPSVEGLRGGYGGKPVLQGVDLDVREGEVTAVIGRNGVGKSTLMRSIMGLLPATAGRIAFRGRDIGALAPHGRARLGLGYVPQGRDVFPRMSVEENLAVGMSGGGAGFEAVYAWFPILRERRRPCRTSRIAVDLNRRTGLTIVLVEQNIDMIRAMAQRCFVMDKGRVVTELTPAMLDDRDTVRRHLAA